MRKYLLAFITLATSLGTIGIGNAQTKSRVMPVEQAKSILTATKQSGWVAFSNQRGKQHIYFSQLQAWHCNLKEIRYSYNSKDLDQVFPLAECNPQIPHNIPREIKWILKFEKLGTVNTMAVQATFTDDTKSEIAVYEPCKDVGEEVCTWLVE